MRVRKNVHDLAAGDSTLDWYATGVAAMRALPAADPRSWAYQAAIHGRPQIPSAFKDWWGKCQHGSSFFLPWHRMYLLHFERIVASFVAAAGGPADWALPYWNYSARREWRVLPAAFRAPRLSSGEPNPLFVEARAPGANDGEIVLSDRDVDLGPCLDADPDTGLAGFFGGEAAAHFAGAFGALEGTVHNNVHGSVGADGWMGDPNFAAQDPIFWLHHANIDRLWDVWKQRPGHHDLTTAFWLSGVAFSFHDANGAIVTLRARDVLETSAPALDYGYDDTSDPFGAPAPAVVPEAIAMKVDHELVGATTAPIQLGAAVEHAELPTPVTPQAFSAASRPGRVLESALPSHHVARVTLQLEHVTSDATSPAYDVYVNVPEDADPKAHEDRYVGRATMFGVAQASDPAGPHAGSGQSFAFDITKLYHRLADAGQVDPRRLRVSFVPVAVRGGAKVNVDKINLYFA